MKRHSGTLKVDMLRFQESNRDMAMLIEIVDCSHTNWKRLDYKEPNGKTNERFQLFLTDDIVALSQTFQLYNVSYSVYSVRE